MNEDGFPYMVTELMALGSVRQLLWDDERELLWPTRLQFASDTASGMEYLHSIGTVHRDLKADNCFVDNMMRVKVGDFGTGRLAVKMNLITTGIIDDGAGGVDLSKTLTRGQGSWLWMAPEILTGKKVTVEGATALDVYRYAQRVPCQ